MKRIAIYLDCAMSNGGTYQYEVTVLTLLAQYNHKDFELVAFIANSQMHWKYLCKKLGVSFVLVSGIRLNLQEMNLYGRIQLLFPQLSKQYLMKHTQMGRQLQSQNIDILFIPLQDLFLSYNIKTIRVCHDLNHRYENFPESREEKRERDLSLKVALLSANIILADSKLGVRQIKESYNCKRARVLALPFVAPPRTNTELNEKELQLIHNKIPEKFVFYPAQLWKHKNHVNLLKAIYISSKKNPDIKLVLAGPARNAISEVKATIKKYNLYDKVILLGAVNDSLIDYLYKHAIAMIMPSYHGPTNLPPLEAMTLGCPVAVSNRYAMPEQVGNAGLLFNPDKPEEIADCINRLWNDEDLRENMIEKGKQRMSRWTGKEFGERLRKMILSI